MSDDTFDPFATTEETAIPAKPAATKTVETPAQVGTEISMTLKGGPGYEEPWVVLRASDVPSANELLGDVEPLKEVLTKTRQASDFFHSTRKAGAAPTAAAPAARAPQAAAPGGEERLCQHGTMQFKTGVSKSTGKPWKAFMCPAAQGDPSQCKAQFLRD